VGNALIMLREADGKDNLDTVRVTVFNRLGPLNVPEYGTYRYTATGAPPGAQWIEPAGGTVVQKRNPSDVDIQWGGGPVVAKAVYQVNDNYVWDLEVNVVQVVVQNPDQGPAFQPGNVIDTSPGAQKEYVQAVGPGLVWRAKVTFNGPNGDRGLRQMRAGFVQNLKVTRLRGTYHNGLAAKSRLEGQIGWDAKPTTSPNERFYNSNPAGFFEDASADRKARIIVEDDSPRDGPPKRFFGWNLLAMELIFDFDLYVVALTTDDRNLAHQIYTGEGLATWQFNGSGAVDPRNNLFRWTSNGAGVTPPPNGWTQLHDGRRPIVTGRAFNEVVNIAPYDWL
jgi:hypothetical protein